MKKTIKKIVNGDIPTGPDVVSGGDGLPDWMQYSISLLVLGTFIWILWMLFTGELDDGFRDLLNIIVGAFLASYSKVTDFWFKQDKRRK